MTNKEIRLTSLLVSSTRKTLSKDFSGMGLVDQS